MFEEVPRERRGVARLVPARRVVLGPFVLGGGMLLAAVGGSVAVAAAAATMITASTIGSSDTPPRPGHPMASVSSTPQSVAARRPPVRHQRATPVAPTAAGLATVARPSSPPPAAVAPVPASASLPAPASTPTSRPPLRSAGPTATPSSPASSPSATPSPSSSAPLGNAVVRVSGYDPASERLAYQFAVVQAGAGAGGSDLYHVIDPDTFTAALAPSLAITSGGGICAPAGSACTRDELIRAADSGFFAVVAIDAQGELRSIIEVGDRSPEPKLMPAPSTGDSRRGNGSPTPGSTP
jgi:hypothetical protein